MARQHFKDHAELHRLDPENYSRTTFGLGLWELSLRQLLDAEAHLNTIQCRIDDASTERWNRMNPDEQRQSLQDLLS